MADVARERLEQLYKAVMDIEDNTVEDGECIAVCGHVDRALLNSIKETIAAQGTGPGDPLTELCEKYRAAARELYEREGQIEVDDGAPVSMGDDPGAYVQAWVWVNKTEAGIKSDDDEAAGTDDDEAAETDDDPLSECQNCGEQWRESELQNVDNIPDIHQRVAPGEPMPSGECPACGALCQLVKPQDESATAPRLRPDGTLTTEEVSRG